MPLLVFQHLLQDQLGLPVGIGQGFQMAAQMAGYPLFCCVHEAQAHPITDQSCCRSHGQGSAVENGVEGAGSGTEFVESLLAPHQVVDLFLRGLLHFRAGTGGFRGECLALVKGLGADFTGMVYAHQAGDVLALPLREIGF